MGNVQSPTSRARDASGLRLLLLLHDEASFGVLTAEGPQSPEVVCLVVEGGAGDDEHVECACDGFQKEKSQKVKNPSKRSNAFWGLSMTWRGCWRRMARSGALVVVMESCYPKVGSGALGGR